MPVEVVAVPITKTPVSELQEYCQKCKKTPEYKLQSTDGKPHSPSFKFICKVDNLQSEGEASSKRQAKHKAAQNLLELVKMTYTPEVTAKKKNIKFRNNKQKPQQQQQKHKKQQKEFKLNLVNPIGSLQEFCALKSMGNVEYSLVSQSGPDHNRNFIFSCKVSSFEQEGNASTKKQAKKIAAVNMLQLITGVEEGKDLSQLFTQKTQMNQYAQLVRESEMKELLTPCDRLEKLAKEILLDFKYLDTQVKTPSGQAQCFLYLGLKQQICVHGCGNNEQEARLDAARNSIDYLKVC